MSAPVARSRAGPDGGRSSPALRRRRRDPGRRSWITPGAVRVAAFAPDGRRAAAGSESGAVLVSDDAGASWQARSATDGAAVSALAFAANGALWIGSRSGDLVRLNFALGPGRARRDSRARRVDHRPPRAGRNRLGHDPTPRRAAIARRGRVLAGSLIDRGLTTDPQAREFERPDFGAHRAGARSERRRRTLPRLASDGLFVSGRGSLRLAGDPVALDRDRHRARRVAPRSRETARWRSAPTSGASTCRPTRERPGHPRGPACTRGAATGSRRAFDVHFSPEYERDGTLFATTWWLLLRSLDRGATWTQWLPRAGGFSVGVSPVFERDRTVYLGTMQRRVLRSTRAGEAIEEVGRVPRPISSLVLSPDFERDRTLFAGQAGALHRSTDAGRTWELGGRGHRLSPRRTEAASRCAWRQELAEQRAAVQLAVSPSFGRDGIVFAGTARGLFRSDDRGLRWQRVLPGIVEAVAVSPDFERDGTLLVSVRGRGLFPQRERRPALRRGRARADRGERPAGPPVRLPARRVAGDRVLARLRPRRHRSSASPGPRSSDPATAARPGARSDFPSRSTTAGPCCASGSSPHADRVRPGPQPHSRSEPSPPSLSGASAGGCVTRRSRARAVARALPATGLPRQVCPLAGRDVATSSRRPGRPGPASHPTPAPAARD